MELNQKIQQYFDRSPNLKVLFFFDDKQEMKEDIDRLKLDDIRLVRYNNDSFNLKVRLNGEWIHEKIFLYIPSPPPSKQEDYKKFPLMDILVANKELRVDDIGEFMEQYHLSQDKQALVGRYIHELKYLQVQDVLKPILNNASFNSENLARGLISVFLKFKEPQPWDLLLAKLFIWTNPVYGADFQRAVKKISENKLESEFTKRLSDLFDENISALTVSSLVAFIKKLKYNVITQNLEKAKHDPYGGLKISHSVSLSRLGMFFDQARNHPTLGKELIGTVARQAQDVREEAILQFYGVNANYGWMPDQLKWLVLNEHLQQLTVNTDSALAGLEKLGLHHEENREIRTILNASLHAGVCMKLISGIKTFRLNSPEEYIYKYAEEYYKIDQTYRKAILKISSVDMAEIPGFVTLESLREELNNRYDGWLEKINREWLLCLKTKNFDYSQLSVPKQYNFYKNEVQPFDQKVVVFISDALRYEVGIDLLNEMHNDRKSEADIRFMLASIPSKTSVGMSNLLPGKKKLFNSDDITIDGITSQSSINREAILQELNKKAVVVSYEELEKNNQEQNRELFKAPMVYVYHNLIDAIGDVRKSESRTFKGVEEAINEIKQMVKKIHSNYNVAKILITADHGFIYNDRPIDDKDKEDMPTGEKILDHSRFVIMKSFVTPTLGYCVPLKATTPFEDDVWVTIPASINRYKRSGSGQQYVHGGGSLQELIVPVIESARKREEISRKVNVKLLTTEPKIVSNILKIELLQESNVSRYEKGRTVKIGIYSGYDLVSTNQEITFDSPSELASERLISISLHLTRSGLGQSALTLKIFDNEDALNPLIEKPVINKSLIQTDF